MKTLEVYPTREIAFARLMHPPKGVRLVRHEAKKWDWINGDTTHIVHVTSLEDARHLMGNEYHKVIIHETVAKMGYTEFLKLLERAV